MIFNSSFKPPVTISDAFYNLFITICDEPELSVTDCDDPKPCLSRCVTQRGTGRLQDSRTPCDSKGLHRTPGRGEPIPITILDLELIGTGRNSN